MLILEDANHNKIAGLQNYKDYYLQKEINQLDYISFTMPVGDANFNSIEEECYILTKDNEYVIKEINLDDDDWVTYVAKVNIEELQGDIITQFETLEQLCSYSVTQALTGTGWSLGNCNVEKLRNVKKNNSSVYEILQEIQTAYICEMTFDAINKKVNVCKPLGNDKGVYITEQINLIKLQIQRNSYDYITRLIPMGKDGLDITSVNQGKKYIENYQYTSKVITGYWSDTRYTSAQDLYDDAVERLEYLSIPYKSYEADIIDLVNISNANYNILDYDLGDTITLIDKEKNIKEKQRIVKCVFYPDEPNRNTVDIANKIASADDLISRFEDTSDTVDNLTNSDGTIDGSKVDGDYEHMPNLVYNSSFGRFDDNLNPDYWDTDGVVSTAYSAFGDYSLYLTNGQHCYQKAIIGNELCDGSKYPGIDTKYGFRFLGIGVVEVSVYVNGNAIPISDHSGNMEIKNDAEEVIGVKFDINSLYWSSAIDYIIIPANIQVMQLRFDVADGYVYIDGVMGSPHSDSTKYVVFQDGKMTHNDKAYILKSSKANAEVGDIWFTTK